jgi:hypothetical protein
MLPLSIPLPIYVCAAAVGHFFSASLHSVFSDFFAKNLWFFGAASAR